MKAEHLQTCQVETPFSIVDLAWTMARRLRNGQVFESVVDLGAGDARFSKPSDAYLTYTGVEVDESKVVDLASLPTNARLIHADAMRWSPCGFDLCIGNPPYIRHHHLDSEWRNEILAEIKESSGIRLKKTANLFVIFLAQALIKTKPDGLVVQVIPFEWVSRPSASELRTYIESQGWDVQVYRFSDNIFPTVLTTASISIIDKSKKSGVWSFWNIAPDGTSQSIKEPSGGSNEVLAYQKRIINGPHALRGLSPGGQDIFVLTEEQRLYYGLKLDRDVAPCVTSLRPLPLTINVLDQEHFRRYYVDAGQRCWLIRSDRNSMSCELKSYLMSVGDAWKKYSTCTLRKEWHKFKIHDTPQILASSGFVGRGPKIATNSIGAIAVGGVYGIFCGGLEDTESLRAKISKYDFSERIVGHSNNLKKVEVRQFNSVLAQLATKE